MADAGPVGLLKTVAWLVLTGGVIAAVVIATKVQNPLPALIVFMLAAVVGLLLLVVATIGANVATIATALGDLRRGERPRGEPPAGGATPW